MVKYYPSITKGPFNMSKKELNAIVKDYKKEIKKIAEEKREQLFMQVAPYIHEICKKFLDQCEELESIVWYQFTPYYNDGEACEFQIDKYRFDFSLNVEFDFKYTGYDYDNKTYSEEIIHINKNELLSKMETIQDSTIDWESIDYYSSESVKKYDDYASKVLNKCCNISQEMIKFLAAEFLDILKEVFGEHAKVRIFKENQKIIAEEYKDHH